MFTSQPYKSVMCVSITICIHLIVCKHPPSFEGYQAASLGYYVEGASFWIIIGPMTLHVGLLMYRITCKECRLYLASYKSTTSHEKTCDQRKERNQKKFLLSICPVCIAAKRQHELMCAVPNMDQEELEWIEEEYVDTTSLLKPEESQDNSVTPIVPVYTVRNP